jgi:hypothetical protein
MGWSFLILAGNFDDINISVTRHNHFKGAPFSLQICSQIAAITKGHHLLAQMKLSG